MTALDKYSRLETAGVWRPAPGEPRSNVTVTFGSSTLTISDMAGRALSHWSLAAVERVNPGQTPPLFAPSAEATETLELDDTLMVEAVERVRRAVARQRPQTGWLRRVSLWAGAALLAYGAIGWLPGAIVDHTARVLPQPIRADVGGQVFRSMTRVSGQPCRSDRGDRTLAQLHARLIAPAKGGILVMPSGVEPSLALPGGLILLNRALIEDYEEPSVAAGYILEESARRSSNAPLHNLLDHVGLIATVRLLTTGQIDPEILEAYSETLVSEIKAQVTSEHLLTLFTERKVASTPYAYARDVSGESVLSLIEGDPMRGQTPPQLLTDADWLALQNICGE